MQFFSFNRHWINNVYVNLIIFISGQSTNVSKVASVVEEKRSHSTSKTNIKSQTSTSRVSSKTATHQNGTTKTPFNPPNTTRKPSNPRFIDLDDSMDEPNPFSKPTFPSSAGQFIKPIQELANTSQVTRNISPPSEQTPLPEQQLVASLILSPELRSLSPLPPSPEQSERLPACLFSPQDNRAGNRTDILAPPPDSTSPPCKRVSGYYVLWTLHHENSKRVRLLTLLLVFC